MCFITRSNIINGGRVGVGLYVISANIDFGGGRRALCSKSRYQVVNTNKLIWTSNVMSFISCLESGHTGQTTRTINVQILKNSLRFLSLIFMHTLFYSCRIIVSEKGNYFIVLW